jgi:hypothetical protein
MRIRAGSHNRRPFAGAFPCPATADRPAQRVVVRFDPEMVSPDAISGTHLLGGAPPGKPMLKPWPVPAAP